MLYFQLSQKTVPPLINDNAQWASGGEGGGGQEEKVIQFLLRGRMMLYSDTRRFVSVLLFFEIFNSQNSNFQGAKSLNNCIFRPELPSLILRAGLCQKSNKCPSE